jgi:hypothetical protein
MALISAIAASGDSHSFDPASQPMHLPRAIHCGVEVKEPSLSCTGIVSARLPQPSTTGSWHGSLPSHLAMCARPDDSTAGTAAERRRHRTKRAVQESAHVGDEVLPPTQRHVAGRPVGIKARETFRPVARDRSVKLDDCGALGLALAPCREGTIESQNRGLRIWAFRPGLT